MTTVAYDGKTMAADSRLTYSGRKHTCKDCKATNQAILDESIKIVLARGKSFRGEKILAIGRAGATHLTSDLIKVLRSDEDFEQTYKHFRMFQTEINATADLLVVTEKSLFHVRAENDPAMVITRHERDVKIAIGSGRIGALVAMKTIGTSAANAIVEVSKHDNGTGGPVNFIDFADEKPNVSQFDPNAVPMKKKPGRKPSSLNKPKVVEPFQVDTKKPVRKAAAKAPAAPVARAPRKPRAKPADDNKHAKAA